MKQTIYAIITNWVDDYAYQTECGAQVNYICFSKEEAIKKYEESKKFFLEAILEKFDNKECIKTIEEKQYVYCISEEHNFFKYHFQIQLQEIEMEGGKILW